MSIRREIFLLKKRLDMIIDYSYGSTLLPFEFRVVDYEIPENAAVIAYSSGKSKEPKKIQCDVTNNVISFTPEGGFFEEGNNGLQFRINSEERDQFSFMCLVRCHNSYSGEDAVEVEENPTLVAQLLTETKLLEARLTNLGTLKDGSTTGDAELQDIRVGHDGVIYDSAGNAVREQITVIHQTLEELANKKAFETVEFDNETRYLHFLDADGLDVVDPVYIEGGGGGTGGGSSSVVKVTNETGATTLSTAAGGKVELSFTFSSEEDDVPTGDGTCQVIVNSVVAATLGIKQGSNTIDVTNYLKSGSNNVRLKCIDVYGNYKLLSFTITVVDLSITSTFDATAVYTGDIQFKYTPYGAIEKTIYFLVDGEEKYKLTTTSSGKQITQIISALSHGVHRLEVYMEGVLDETTIESAHLVYEILCTETDATIPMIASVYDVATVSQGTQVSIPYLVYDPSALTCDISLIVYTIADGKEVMESETELTVDRTQQTWNTRKYPMGDVYFKILYEYTDATTGETAQISKEHKITVTESTIDVEPITNDLELYLTAAGRSNSEATPSAWEYNDVQTTFDSVNWLSTGWMEDENGDTVLRLNGDATAEISFMPFNSDLRVYGKTIELEFAIRDVNNRDAVVIDCMSGGIGFCVTADKATLQSEQTTVSCNYKDEKRIRLAFVIEARSEYRLMMVYLNGVLSGVKQYPADDNFQQHTPVNIKIGSQYCGVDIYTIRSYTNALTFTEVIDNYIADMADIVKKSDLYDANDIYDEYGQLSYEELKKRISVLTIIGDLPQSKGDKKNVTLKYDCLFNPAYSFEDSASIDVQGTSSQWYVRKNYKTKSTEAHQHDDNQIATNVFCFKADYAEATGTHNTQNANFVATLYSEKTPAQLVDERCRTTIYGYPIVVFHQATANSTPQFIGKYNFNFDKGSEEVYGFTKEYDVESWEFLNNTSSDCNFTAALSDKPTDNFEARYPDGYKDFTRFKEMHDWVVSTIGDVDKFRNEFENYFDLHFTLIYYAYTFFALMVDQRAKNMFLTYWASTGKWQPWFYDNDTCFGINNEGELVFDYWHEDTDLVNNEYVYNGQGSTLWNNFREAFADEIKETYQDLRNNGLLTYDKLIEYFITNGSNQWSESVYNEDGDYKYVSMLKSNGDASNLYQVRGTGEEHLEYFLENRLNYCDGKWEASDYMDDYVSMRIYTPTEWAGVEPNANVTVTPFSNCYASMQYKANGEILKERAEKNVAVTFEAPQNEDFSDTESACRPASQISSLGDLAPLYPGTLNVSKANKLIELKVGDATEGYVNEHMTSLSVGANRLLKKIDVRNCPNLTDPLALGGCPNIEEIYATGSGITGVELVEGGWVKTMQLPATLTSLTLKKQHYIEELTLEGYDTIKTLWIEDCPTIDELAIFENCTNVERVRLTDVDWSFDDTSFLYEISEKGIAGIDENGINTDTLWIDGKCHITSLTGAEMAELKALFPYLTITYTNLTAELIYMSDDGTVELYRETINNGGDGTYAGETPTKESTAQYTYAHSGWSTTIGGSANANALKNVTADRTVYAAFTSTVRTYTVYFYNDTTLLLTVPNVPYGGSATYTGSTPVKGDDYEFKGWEPEPANIKGNTYCYATYNNLGEIADSWATIAANVANGTATSLYGVGSVKMLEITNDDGTTETIPMEIVAHNHDDKADGSGKASLTFIAKNVLSEARKMNDAYATAGGWSAMSLRTWLNGDFLATLPSDLQSALTEVKKLSDGGYNNAEITTSNDKVWIPSVSEVNSEQTTVVGQGEVYPTFTDSTSRIRTTIDGTARAWWIRSANITSYGGWYNIYSSGGWGSVKVNATGIYILIGFCI